MLPKNIDERDQLGRTVLHYAAMKNDTAKVAELLTAGADPNLAEYREKYTPLHLAVQDGAIDSLQLLLAAGADVSAIVAAPNNPLTARNALHIAVQKWRKSPDGSVIKALITAGADKQSLNGSGQTPLQLSHNIYSFPSELRTLLT